MFCALVVVSQTFINKHMIYIAYLLHNPHVNGQYVLNVDVQILGSLQLTNVLSAHVLVVTCCAENRLRHYAIIACT